ncbi:MAG: hypothetical protein QM820_19045 [Minicystis sp.]
MGDAIVLGGDKFTVESAFEDATLSGKLNNNMIAVGGGGRVKIKGKPVCVQGDESVSIFLPGLMYKAGSFSNPAGAGLVRYLSLAPDQVSKRVSVNGKKVMLKGSQFKALFQGMSPAMQPTATGPMPDPMVAKPRTGQGTIDAKETKVKAL